jgi:hypothetical protein
MTEAWIKDMITSACQHNAEHLVERFEEKLKSYQAGQSKNGSTIHLEDSLLLCFEQHASCQTISSFQKGACMIVGFTGMLPQHGEE